MKPLDTCLLIVLLIALTVAESLGAIPGTTTVPGPIAPSSTGDTYASHYAQYGKGGFRSVLTIGERDAITTPRREQGMLVYVREDDSIYQLGTNLVSWTKWQGAGGSSQVIDSITQLLSLDTSKLTDGASFLVLGRTAAGDWGGDVRPCKWNATSTAATNSIFTFGSGTGRFEFSDSTMPFIRPEWSVAFSAADAATAITDATRLAGTNGVVQFSGGRLKSGRIYIDSSVTKRGSWRGQGDISAAEGGLFGDRTIIQLKDAANTNLVVIDGQVTFSFQGLVFDGNKANQSATEDLVQIKGTTAYYNLWIDQTKFNNSKGRALAIYDRPQVYVNSCSFAGNQGDSLWGTNIVDFVSHGTLIGKNLGSGFVGYNFTSLRLYTFDIFQNLGKNLRLECVPGYSGGFSELKDGRLQMSGEESLFLKGGFKVVDIDNVLMERANADSAVPYWVNGAASGTYSTMLITTNSAGNYPRELRFHNVKWGFAENIATKFPKYHIENNTPASINIHTFENPTFVNYTTPVVSPVNGLGNFNTTGMDLERASMFLTSQVPVTQRAMQRLTVGGPDVNTNYVMSVIGPIQLQESATPVQQWTITPDLVTKKLVIKHEIDGDPLWEMNGEGGFKQWVGGVPIAETDTNGFRVNGGGAIQFNITTNTVSVSNRLAVATAPATGFPLTVRGPVLLQNTSSPGSVQWTLNPDQSGTVFALKDNTDGDPAFFGETTGYFSMTATKGFIPPILTQTQEDAATFPNNATWINSTLNEYRRYKPGTGPVTIGGGGSGSVNVNGSSVSSPDFISSWGSKVANNAGKITFTQADPVTLTYAATLNPNLTNGVAFKVTLTGDATLGAVSNPVDDQPVRMYLRQDATGTRQVTLDTAGWKLPEEIPASFIATNANALTVVVGRYDSVLGKVRVEGFLTYQ